MLREIAVGVACLGLVAGCGKGKDGGDSCPAGEVTLDGQKLGNSFGRAIRSQGATVIQLYDHDNVTCEEMLTSNISELMELAASRGKSNDEISVRVSIGGQFPNAIGLGGNTLLDSDKVKAKLVAQPAKVGDQTAICLTEPAEYELQVGPHKGKKLVMQGLFEGKYCGERQ